MSKPVYHSIYKYSPLSSLEKAVENSDINDPDRLYLDYYDEFLEQDIDALLDFLDKPNIQIARLNITLPLDLIKTEKFKQLIKKLNSDAMRYLKLSFDRKLDKRQVNAALLDSGIADLAFYPLKIGLPWPEALVAPYGELLDKTFIKKNINKVRYYEEQCAQRTAKVKASSDADPNLPRIKLKELISNPAFREDDKLVSIDVAIEAEAQVEAQIVLDIAEDVEAQLVYYTGPKYDFAQFKKEQYSYLDVSRARNGRHDFELIELFAQLPAAIQYITPAATKRLYADFSQLASFNDGNLPPGMFLQRTPEGALVLDYEIGHERNYNAFTPIDNLRCEEEELAYFDPLLLPNDFMECTSQFSDYHKEIYIS